MNPGPQWNGADLLEARQLRQHLLGQITHDLIDRRVAVQSSYAQRLPNHRQLFEQGVRDLFRSRRAIAAEIRSSL